MAGRGYLLGARRYKRRGGRLALEIALEGRDRVGTRADELEADARLALTLGAEHPSRPGNTAHRLERLTAGQRELEQDAPSGQDGLAGQHAHAAARDVGRPGARVAEEGAPREGVGLRIDAGQPYRQVGLDPIVPALAGHV
jgi:hypothetical protein